MEKLPSNHQETSVTLISKPNTVLRELPKADVIKALCDQLDQTAKLFSIPNWDQITSVLLAEWILENYHSDTFETIFRALKKPRITEKVWRLTPDTLTDWISSQIEHEAEQREKAIHNERVKESEQPNEWDDERFKQLYEQIEQAPGFSRGPALSPQEVEEEGQERPKKYDHAVYQTSPEEAISKALHIEWIKVNYDPITGKKKTGWISEDEWIRLNS